MPIRTIYFSLLIFIGSTAFAQKIPIPVLTQKSAELTTLSAPGGVPFHLMADITVKQHPNYQAVIEEDWISPQKWHRTIKSRLFSQTIVVNGDKYYEKNDGEYFPVGLQTLSRALVQPIPDRFQTALSQSKVKLDMYGGALADGNICDSDLEKTGTPPKQGAILLEVCFSGNPSSISVIRIPFYDIQLEDRQPFGKLSIARHLVAGENESIEWDAQVTVLTAITNADESLFAVPESTPEDQRFKVFLVSEEDFRHNIGKIPEELILPLAQKENKTGVVTVFLSTDKDAFVAEAWTEEHEYPEISDAASQEVSTWKLGDAKNAGHMVQLETFLTIPYKTQLAPKGAENSSPPK
jgi:hypothetical protein